MAISSGGSSNFNKIVFSQLAPFGIATANGAVTLPVQSSPKGKRQTNPATTQALVFKIVFERSFGNPGEFSDVPESGGSVVVEVESEKAPETSAFGCSNASVRDFAEEVAQWAALQAIQKDLPHGATPVCSVSLLTRLPDELQQRHPTLHTCQARSWLL